MTGEEVYIKSLNSGMFWEIYPTLTGNGNEDKDEFIRISSEFTGGKEILSSQK